MQVIEFYCRKCKKSMKMNYCLCGNDDMQVMHGMQIKCHTRKCTRVVTLMHFTEGKIKANTDASGKYYL